MFILKFYLSNADILRCFIIFILCMIGFVESTQWVFDISQTNRAFEVSMPIPWMFVVFNFLAWLVFFFGLND